MSAAVRPASAAPEPSAWLEAWCRFAADLRFEDLPRDVVDRTRQVLFDSIGAIAAGAQEPEVKGLTERLAALGGSGGVATAVIGADRRLPAGTAAFLNGTAGTTLELDEGNQFARGHPGIHVVPAALAAAERLGSSGRDLVKAIALGYEIGARVGIAAKILPTMHPHGTWGTLGAAVAVASLHGADAARMREVIGMAATLGLATSRRTMLEGGTVRNSFAGFSNEIGLRVWEMAEAGFVAEAGDGVATVYGTVIATDFRPELLTEDLGTRWEIARNYFKRHAACRYTHGALDALGAIVAQAGGRIDPDAVASITVDTYVWAAQLDGQDPRNMLAAKFSLPFALATSIVNGAATVEAFREGARNDARTLALAHTVTVREDPALTAKLPGLRPARVAVALKDGRVLTAEALTNRGDTEDPYTAAEVAAKYREIAGPVFGPDRTEAILSACLAIDAAASVRPLCDLLAA
ncbi:MmgE/PrpD family protein [uncultured Alsobacter sp.]|uniref:MmgE/PrpD family protein n=1 Tax=uncultured Alsobacter sp. TaxID=1748258 RepID=UPI0025D06937|nr:MmgE/PrpD family protein [uncultured Alsobacter sp.]